MEVQVTLRCPSCDHDNRADRLFCAECGAALTAGCASCGAVNLPGEKFCGGCGARLPTVAPATGAPTPTAEPAAAVPAGERRQLTLLFCDLVGSTLLSQQLDAEEWRDLLAQYQQAASAAVVRFGGHVAKNLGDGLLIYFGWPVAREDDPERAVRAGLDMVEAVRRLVATRLGEEDSASLTANSLTAKRLSIRVGMHTGPVVIADGGEVFGETANIAARVQSAADPDTVVITAATQRLVTGLFVVEERGAQPLKGVRELLALYRVVQPSGVRSRLQVAAGRLTRFVGREAELATLVDRWERAQEGDGQTVLVLGEAGVGKSRLVYELHEHLAAVPHTWLECGATPYTEGTPFHPVIALVAQGLAFAPEDSVAEKLGKLEVGLRTLASAETVALLADFLGLPPPTPLQMSPELQRRKTIDLLARWNLSPSAAQPLVVVVEDLHWCDASTLELLGHVIAQSATARVLLLGTARPEFSPPWPARSNVTTVQLARLTRRQARVMVAALGADTLPEEMVETLVARADGMPLFVEELTKAVVEPGVARGMEAIPPTLADSLMARLDRLSTAKEVAQRAAVLGREFAYPLLAAVADLEEAGLRQGLARLLDAEIVFARGEPPNATYTFKHALVQEAAYGSLLKRTRQQLHGRVVDVLLERFPEHVESDPEIVARHAEAAGRIADAVGYYQRAGEAAKRRSAHEEAIRHLRTAIRLLEGLPETDARECALQLALAPSLLASRGYAHEETAQAWERAGQLAEKCRDEEGVTLTLLQRSLTALTRGELMRADEMARRGIEIGRARRDDEFALIGYVNLGISKLYQGDFVAARKLCEQTIAFYDPGRHAHLGIKYGTDGGVAAHGWRAWALWFLGYPDQSRAEGKKAVDLARTVDHPHTLACVLMLDGEVAWTARDLASQRALADEVIALSETQGFPIWLGLGRAFRAASAVQAGNADEVQVVGHGLAMAGGTGLQVSAPALVALLAEAQATAGRLEEAIGTVEMGLAVAAGTSQHFFDAELHRLKGEIQLGLRPDGTSDAEALFRRALEIARAQQARSFELRAATSLARLWQRQGKRAEAHALLAPVYAWFTEGFDTGDLVEAKALLDELT
jgi:class 3 adenylate cyclase/predicted ATPase